jgi:8-amino-7-oxononanoate synthase
MKGRKVIPSSLTNLLEQRSQKNSLRILKTQYPPIDFSGNDYLGFSTKGYLAGEIQKLSPSKRTGSGGSRLISGNSLLFEETEKEIAAFHHAESALIYNSGYDANLGLLSSVPQKKDLVLSDELIHASLIDGIRLSYAAHYKFRHNDVDALRNLIVRHKESFQNIYVVVESVYSMDGDCAPLKALVALSAEYDFNLIVDEAHAIGVFGARGRGLCHELQIEQDCFARIYTYGKAMGCHGAAIVGNEELRTYLVNFSRSFIYTTAMPEHSLLAIKAAYNLLQTTAEIEKLKEIIRYFNQARKQNFIDSNSPIHCHLRPGNEAIQALEDRLNTAGFFVKSIKSPTVKENQERLRICLHAFNTQQEIDGLLKLLGH